MSYRIRRELRVDWFRVLADLRRLGFSQNEVAKQTAISRSTLLGWHLRTSEPAHAAGERLIAFWCTVMDRPRESLPMFDGYDEQRPRPAQSDGIPSTSRG